MPSHVYTKKWRDDADAVSVVLNWTTHELGYGFICRFCILCLPNCTLSVDGPVKSLQVMCTAARQIFMCMYDSAAIPSNIRLF